MVTTRYSDQQGSKSRQNPCQVQPTENIGNLSASRRCLWVRTTVTTVWSGVLPVLFSGVLPVLFSGVLPVLFSGVLPVLFQYFRISIIITSYTEGCLVCCPIQQSHQTRCNKFSSSSYHRRVTRRQVMRHFTSNDTNVKTSAKPTYSISRATSIDSTRIVVAYPRPAFSATKRANHAPTGFGQQAQVFQSHT